MEAALQVRLVKAREGHAGIHGHEQRVEIFGVVVLVFKPGNGLTGRGDGRGEIQADRIVPCLKQVRCKLNVSVLDGGRLRLAVEHQAGESALPKIKKNRCGLLQPKVNLLNSGARRRSRYER